VRQVESTEDSWLRKELLNAVDAFKQATGRRCDVLRVRGAECLPAAESRPTPGSEGSVVSAAEDYALRCVQVTGKKFDISELLHLKTWFYAGAKWKAMNPTADVDGPQSLLQSAAPASVGAATPPQEDPLANVLYAHVYRGAPSREVGICSKHSYSFAEYETSCPYCVTAAAAPVPPRGAEPQAASVSALVERLALLQKTRPGGLCDDGCYGRCRVCPATWADELLAVAADAIAALTPTPAGPWTREKTIDMLNDLCDHCTDHSPYGDCEGCQLQVETYLPLPTAPERTPR
jgi:hypothetical protein